MRFCVLAARKADRNRKCRKCLHNLCRGASLTDVLTARDLPLRPSCRKARLVAMAVVKAILSFYRSGEEKPVERYKTRVKVTEEHKLLSSFRKNVIEFLGINEQAQKFGLGSYELKLWRLVKSNGKTAENLGITTQQQLDLELPFLLGSEGESELNGKKSVI